MSHRGVVAILTNAARSKVLLQQKDANYAPHPRGYSFFGGAIDPGEDRDEAMVRELREELGEEATILPAPTFLWVDDVPPNPFRLAVYEIVVDDAVLVRLAESPVLEGERAVLVDRSDLASMDFIWGLAAVAERYLRDTQT
ncbi:MAG: NUDIX domain-containing protein [Myxococcota bacterium]